MPSVNKAALIGDYVKGLSFTQLAGKYGISPSTAGYHIKKAGISRSSSEGVRLASKHGRLGGAKSHNRLELSGLRFGALTVLGLLRVEKKKSIWQCACDCGAVVQIIGSSLTTGNTSSCGCQARKLTGERSRTHGMSDTALYRRWQGMLTRCENPNSSSYPNYGGRGIKVCDKWHSFENFLDDMGEPPAKSYSIERIDNNGDYAPENCKWASRAEQSRNTRKNRVIEFRGASMCLKDWADDLGMDQASLKERLDKWTLDAALTTPKKEMTYGKR